MESNYPRRVSLIMKVKILLVLLTVISYGCISPPRHATVINVPFRPQEQTNHCGVVSLAMALDYYNITYNITNLIEEAFIPALNGSSLELLADTANKYGINTEIHSILANNLQQIIVAKHIPIIYLSPLKNSDIGHFAIITGISSNGRKLRIHETDRPNHWVQTSNICKRSTDGIFPALTLSMPEKTR